MTESNSAIGEGIALIIVPPFSSTTMPSLAAHILQSCAQAEGYKIHVLYANLIFAAEIGLLNYEALCRSSPQYLLGERLFSAAAYGLPSFGSEEFVARLHSAHLSVNNNNISVDLKISDLQQWERASFRWADHIAKAVTSQGCKVVGCTTTFEQTNASVALLNRIKRLSPNTVTIIGGANCEGEMAEGILSLDTSIDYVFSGESESSLPRFLAQLEQGQRPSLHIIHGEACLDLEHIPTPEYTEFYQQRERWLPSPSDIDGGNTWIPYESSRGCWWGEKHHCTFCGLNGEMMRHRQKSADRVLSELRSLVKANPTHRVCMTDNIMPHDYFKTLLPRLPDEVPDVTIFYELKANLSLRDVVLLRKAGIKLAQPGIESLSSACLKLMKKGVTARQNISLLRYARAVGLWLGWNMLYAFPGDDLAEYERMLQIIPMLRHLQPPLGLSHLSLERFSPYFRDPQSYGIRDLRCLSAYREVFPRHADVSKLAYHFEADYASGSKAHPALVRQLETEIEKWRDAWKSDEEWPTLALTAVGDECYLLLDTRGLSDTQELSLLNQTEAMLAVSGFTDSADALEWALQRKVVIELDSRIVPLATADLALLERVVAQSRSAERKMERVGGTDLPPVIVPTPMLA